MSKNDFKLDCFALTLNDYIMNHDSDLRVPYSKSVLKLN